MLEESPSPKKFGTWTMGVQNDDIVLPHLSSVLNKWLIAKQLNYSYGPSGSLSKILETPAMPMEPFCSDGFDASTVKTPEKSSLQVCSGLHSVPDRFNSNFMSKEAVEGQTEPQKSNEVSLATGDEGCEGIDVAIKKLSLTSRSGSLVGDHWDSFSALLTVCEQSAPSALLDVLSKYWFVTYSFSLVVFPLSLHKKNDISLYIFSKRNICEKYNCMQTCLQVLLCICALFVIFIFLLLSYIIIGPNLQFYDHSSIILEKY